MVDLLAIVVVEENPEPQVLEERVDEVVPDAMNLIAADDSILEGNLQDHLALVTTEDPPPL
ncbi:hypothetical protein AMTR_s00056p00129190 [Amborella trichopoda]|uniref:Uncharacterized protein n=1 Tax=Amborella trichopoda TaxID=13333 RepID=U5D183_AMBTC|nr:hypothetical protein AMTR_s00056p00129190 [Amborella trichopoda]